MNPGEVEGLLAGKSPFRARLASLAWSTGLWLSVCLLWICCRPYRGVRHDAILYTAQILNRVDPSTFGADVFFKHGSQDRYTVFSSLMAPLLDRFGITGPEFLLMSLCHLALLLVVARLLTTLGLRAWRWPALLVLACLPHIYGARGGLAFAEAFLTARTLTEPFAVGALVCLLERRWALAALASALAIACHPLIMLPVLVVGWVALALQDRRWLWLALAFLAFPLLGWFGLAPFDGLVRTYDAAWWSLVSERNLLVMVTKWSPADLQLGVTDIVILGCAWRSAELAVQRRLWLSTLIATIGLLAVSLVGVDLLHDVLIAQMQVWRVLWWTHLATLIALPVVLAGMWRGNALSRVAALSLAVAAFASGAAWQTTWVFLLVWAAAAGGSRTRFVLSTALYRVLVAVMVMAVLTISLLELRADLQAPVDGIGVGAMAWYRFAITVPVVGLTVGGLALWWQARFPRAGALVVAGLVLFALGQWDQRSDWNRFLEADNPPAARPFAGLVPAGAEVFWDEDLKATWFGMRRPSFYSVPQAGGLLFNRATAMDFRTRMSAVGPFETQRQLCGFISTVDASTGSAEGCKPTPAAVHDLCSGRTGPLFLVFKFPLQTGVVGRWTFVSPDSGARTDYYLHDCRQIDTAAP